MPKFSRQDLGYMERALALGYRAKGRTFPNPAVGAVIVKDGRTVGEGATQACGKSHAEIVALGKAGSDSQGATMYVTLEPCCHRGRTPPCTDALVAAKLKEIVVAIKDPNPLVAGRGVEKLRRAGIRVRTGLLKNESAKANEEFFWSINTGRPWITLKLAMTFDGRIADSQGNSKWITGPESRKLVHELRRSHAAIAIGSGTLKKDDPLLTTRHVRGQSPTRIVFASNRDALRGTRIEKTSDHVRSLVVTPGLPAGVIKTGKTRLEIWQTGKSSQLSRFTKFLDIAQQQGMTSIFVEGGQKLASFLMKHQLVNRIYLFYGNAFVGDGKTGLAFPHGPGISAPIRLSNQQTKSLGQDFMVTGIPLWPKKEQGKARPDSRTVLRNSGNLKQN